MPNHDASRHDTSGPSVEQWLLVLASACLSCNTTNLRNQAAHLNCLILAQTLRMLVVIAALPVRKSKGIPLSSLAGLAWVPEECALWPSQGLRTYLILATLCKQKNLKAALLKLEVACILSTTHWQRSARRKAKCPAAAILSAGPWASSISATWTVRIIKSQAPLTCLVRRSRGGAGDRNIQLKDH